MKSVKIVQKHLPALIKVVFLPGPTEIGRFTVRILENIIPEIKRDLELDFDKIKIYVGPQPRESGDIELYKEGKLIKKISVKTAVTGEIRVALRKIWTDLVKGMDGIILAFAYAKTSENKDLTKLLVIYLPNEVTKHDREEVLEEIEIKLAEKTQKEGYQSLWVFAANEALMFELVYRAIIAEEKADKAYEEAKKAHEEAKKASEKADKAYEEAKRVREKIENVDKNVKEILKLLSSK